MRAENVPSFHVLLSVGLLGLTACSDSRPVDPTTGQPVEPITEMQDGVAILFSTDGTGNCNFEPTPNSLIVAALNTNTYNQAAQCGACAEVEGPQGESVVVRVIDVCPSCTENQLALSSQALGAIAPPESLQTTMRWRYVTCGVEGPVRYRFKEESGPYWTAVQVRNHRLPISKFEWQKDGAWVEVKRESYNYFVETSGMGAGPVKVRITANDGQLLEDTLPSIAGGLVVDGAAQFKVD
ncbi:expansin EXLX1 family cellulose-binding protein [Hyalangium rubrum]|uniref:Expansin EXLX1 family cellulose-binding protein n=1 Tax=Hyalangium rubrum TaxID=3103134 RepID=A0ABU5H2Z3_9BACT|nr:expansin EXLX1 family cellulose-binding protein [Hyalangium sp. s54d21]MDY7227469.1 expansin EXLX1 family cellulose-binding protein [Hyalangium sp. s54d21]